MPHEENTAPSPSRMLHGRAIEVIVVTMCFCRCSETTTPLEVHDETTMLFDDDY
jgi:hypothetical protein